MDAFEAAVRVEAGSASRKDIMLRLQERLSDALFQMCLDLIEDESYARRDLGKRFGFWLEQFPKHRWSSIAAAISKSYLSQPKLLSPDLSTERASRLIDDLREQTGGPAVIGELGFPPGDALNRHGDEFVQSRDIEGPARELIRMGRIAVPALINGLHRDDYTRIASGDAEYPILTVGDVCERILEQIAGKVFLDHEVTKTPMQSSHYLLATQRITLWWERNQSSH